MVSAPALGIVYGLTAAAIFGCYLFLYKRYFDHYSTIVYVSIVHLCGLLWYVPIAYLTLPRDARLLPRDLPSPTGALVTVMIVLSVVGIVLSIHAIQSGDLSYVTPLNRLTPVFVVPIELLLLSTYLRPPEIVGIALATTAVYVANFDGKQLLAPFSKALTYRPAQLALASATVYGGVDVAKRVLLQELALPPQALVLAIFIGTPLLLAPLAIRRLTTLPTPREGLLFLLVGGLIGIGEHIVALTFAALPASLGAPLISLQSVVAVLLGGFVLRESGLDQRLVAAAFAVIGAGLIAMG